MNQYCCQTVTKRGLARYSLLVVLIIDLKTRHQARPSLQLGRRAAALSVGSGDAVKFL